MKKLFLALALPVCLMAGVSFENDNSMEKLEKQQEETNKHLEKVNKALEKANEALEKIFKALHPYAFDTQGKLLEEE